MYTNKKHLGLIWLTLIFGFIGCFTETDRLSEKNIDSAKLIFGSIERNVIFEDGKATVLVPDDTDLNGSFEFETSEEAILTYNNNIGFSGMKVSFDEAKPFTFSVVAEDESSTNYQITVVMPRSSIKAVTKASIAGVAATIDSNVITAIVPFGSDLSQIQFDFEYTGIDATEESGVLVDLSQKKYLTITATDNTRYRYIIRADVADLVPLKALGVKSVNTGEVFSGVLEDNIFKIELPDGTDLSNEKFFLDISIPDSYRASISSEEQLMFADDQLQELKIAVAGGVQLNYYFQINIAEGLNGSADDMNSFAELLDISVDLELPPDAPFLIQLDQETKDVKPVINHELGTVEYTFSADLGKYLDGNSFPYTVQLPEEATSDKQEDILVSLTNPTVLTITSANGLNQKQYTIRFIRTEPISLELKKLMYNTDNASIKPFIYPFSEELTYKASVKDLLVISGFFSFELDERVTFEKTQKDGIVVSQIDNAWTLSGFSDNRPSTSITVTSPDGEKADYIIAVNILPTNRLLSFSLVKIVGETKFRNAFVDRHGHLEGYEIGIQEEDAADLRFRYKIILDSPETSTLVHNGKTLEKTEGELTLQLGDNVFFTKGVFNPRITTMRVVIDPKPIEPPAVGIIDF